MSASADFRLSRIYAKGWNAAGRLTSNQVAALDSASVAVLNPYTVETDRARWTEGFAKALGATDALTFRSAPGYSAAGSSK